MDFSFDRLLDSVDSAVSGLFGVQTAKASQQYPAGHPYYQTYAYPPGTVPSAQPMAGASSSWVAPVVVGGAAVALILILKAR